MKASESGGTLKITLKRSCIGRLRTHKSCARGLGLRRIGQTVVVQDTPSNRGMVERIRYMLDVEEAGR